MSVLKEFREFISKGNVIDLAVGVIIGTAFGKIITSLVDDIIMPGIGYVTGGVDFSEKKMILITADAGNKIQEVAIRYGNFVNIILQFLIVAICIFGVIKMINKLRRKEENVAADSIVPSKEEVLLTDIRDILKSQRNQ